MNNIDLRIRKILETSSGADCDEEKMEILDEFLRRRPLEERLPLLMSDSAKGREDWNLDRLGTCTRAF